jgi:flagellar basal-body rod protein FlgB
MDLSHIPIFEALTKRMSWLTERQTVLAENVANANTPGYVAKDLKEPDFKALLGQTTQGVQLVVTQPGQISAAGPGRDFPLDQVVEDKSIDGNGVSVEEQMMKVSTNAADYAVVTSLYKDHISLIKMVLGGGGGG